MVWIVSLLHERIKPVGSRLPRSPVFSGKFFFMFKEFSEK